MISLGPSEIIAFPLVGGIRGGRDRGGRGDREGVRTGEKAGIRGITKEVHFLFLIHSHRR
jgi:hypothetical protein